MIIKYSKEQKLQACISYSSGEKSVKQIAEELKMGPNGKRTVLRWISMYRNNGSTAFIKKYKRQYYSKAFKEKIIAEYLNEGKSASFLTAKYNISSFSIIPRWLKQYNVHKEFKNKDINPRSKDTAMFKSTLEERIAIVEYCLNHNGDIQETISVYGCSRGQLYTWLKKYKSLGKDGLIDNRGKYQNMENLSDIEKANRKIKQLEHEKESFRKKYELLKKAEQRERW